MKLKPLVLLALALGCGLVAMLGVQQMMAKREAPVQEEMAKVLVAMTEVEAGKPLELNTNVEFKDWPKDKVPLNAVTAPEEFDKRALKYPAAQGEVIVLTKLGDPGVKGASTSIPKGMRLTTVPITMTAIQAGMVQPSDRVDIICTYMGQIKGKQVTRAKTVLENLEVFAIDRQRQGTDAGDSNKGSKYESLTLLCTPEQAVMIQMANKKGQLQMALRNKNDPPEKNAKTVSVDDEKFDEAETGQGELTPDPDAVANADNGAAGLRKVMADHQDEEDKKPAAEPAVDPDQWVIKIYEGGGVREAIVGQPPTKLEKKDAPQQTPQKKAPQKPKKPATSAV